jgi:UDP-N-acetylmuramoyl-tripeptide--D-alanyl-D-alanine ligase
MEIHELYQLFLQSTGITTDTRKIEKGQLYFALKGGNFNGNTFASKAIEQGASLRCN